MTSPLSYATGIDPAAFTPAIEPMWAPPPTFQVRSRQLVDIASFASGPSLSSQPVRSVSGKLGAGGNIWVMSLSGATFTSVYEREARDLTRFATGLVGPSDACDVVADAMVRLMASKVWDQASNHRALMYRAVLYEARMFHRAQHRRWFREARAAMQGVYEIPDLQPEVAAAVERLSPQQRAVIFLTYWDDLDAVRVARLLGVSRGTVEKQLSRARKRLREVLK